MLRPSQRHFANENLDPRLRAGLVGHWIGGGSGLTWFDRSGRGNHGQIGSACTWDFGPRGQRAMRFANASGSYVSYPMVSTPSIPITFAFWVKSESASPVGIFDTAPSSTYVLRNYPAGNIEWHSGSVSLPLTLTISEWTHVAISFYYDTNRRMLLYKNGVLTGSASGDTASNTAWTTLRLGDINSGSAGRFAGVLDDFRIYNRVLSAAEINLLAKPEFLPVIPRRWFASAIPNRRRSISISGSRASYSLQGSHSSHSISGSRSSYLIEGS